MCITKEEIFVSKIYVCERHYVQEWGMVYDILC